MSRCRREWPELVGATLATLRRRVEPRHPPSPRAPEGRDLHTNHQAGAEPDSKNLEDAGLYTQTRRRAKPGTLGPQRGRGRTGKSFGLRRQREEDPVP